MCVVARRWTRQVAIPTMIEARDKMKARMPNAMLILLSADKDRAMRNIMLDLVPWADLRSIIGIIMIIFCEQGCECGLTIAVQRCKA